VRNACVGLGRDWRRRLSPPAVWVDTVSKSFLSGVKSGNRPSKGAKPVRLWVLHRIVCGMNYPEGTFSVLRGGIVIILPLNTPSEGIQSVVDRLLGTYGDQLSSPSFAFLIGVVAVASFASCVTTAWALTCSGSILRPPLQILGSISHNNELSRCSLAWSW